MNQEIAVLARAWREHTGVMEQSVHVLSDALREAATQVAERLRGDGALLLCGNGGSAADSQHLAAEFVGRFRANRRPLRALALTTDTSALTCIANDFGYDDVFARQVEGVGRRGDVLVVISTSGQSENILRALRSAKANGILTVAFLGKGGGPAAALTDIPLVVPSNTTARIQEVHIFLGHVLCEVVEDQLGFGAGVGAAASA